MEHFLHDFWKSVHKRGPDDCWLWLNGFSGHNGLYYGRTSIGGREVKADRMAWELHHRRRIPDGLLIRHTCDNTMCCNPAHLVLGTVQDNTDDKMKRGRFVPRGSRVKPVDNRFRICT